jgi:hypothetical protein
MTPFVFVPFEEVQSCLTYWLSETKLSNKLWMSIWLWMSITLPKYCHKFLN